MVNVDCRIYPLHPCRDTSDEGVTYAALGVGSRHSVAWAGSYEEARA
jgi:hypothetical protein